MQHKTKKVRLGIYPRMQFAQTEEEDEVKTKQYIYILKGKMIMKKKIVKLIALLCMLAMLFTLAGCGEERDVVHDEDGFLGYSDSFWEWWADQ